MDNFLLHQLNQFAGRWQAIDFLAIFVAEWLPYLAVVLLYGSFLISKSFKKQALFEVGFSIIIALFVRFPITWLIHVFVDRARPFVIDANVTNLLAHDPTNSFPSGHSTFFFTCAAMLFLLDRKRGFILFLVAILMGLARIFGGVHWPTDILAGAILGIITALVVHFVFGFQNWIRLFPTS